MMEMVTNILDTNDVDNYQVADRIITPNSPTASRSRARAYQEVNGRCVPRRPASNRQAESTNMAMAEMSTQ